MIVGTRVKIVKKDNKGKEHERFLHGPVAGKIIEGNGQITMYFQAPPDRNIVILGGQPGATSLEVTKTAAEICQPGGNIFFRYVERCGQGLLKVNTVGLIQVQYRLWWFWISEIKVQYYQSGGKLFTPSLIHQKGLEAELKKIVAGDTDIPSYSEYHEYTVEPCTIKWFDPFRMIGCISSPDPTEDVFFHWNNFHKSEKPYIGFVKAGAKVAYTADPSNDSSAFALKATWVKLI